MSLLDHAMSIAGFQRSFIPRLKPGWTLVKVRWDGCMATTRVEEDVGDFLRYEAKKLYPDYKTHNGIVVRWDEGGEQWEPWAHVRYVDGQFEIWH